jgi:hypothetical protein
MMVNRPSGALDKCSPTWAGRVKLKTETTMAKVEIYENVMSTPEKALFIKKTTRKVDGGGTEITLGVATPSEIARERAPSK